MPLEIVRRSIAAGYGHTVALKSDGTCVGVGRSTVGQINVGSWTGIVSVFAGQDQTFGIKADGTCVATGDNASGQCNVSGWTNVVSIGAGNDFTVGLKSDGTCVSTGDNTYGQRNISAWTNIVGIATGHYHTVGIKADGTCVAVGFNTTGQCNVSGWTNIVAVAAGYGHTVGLKADGTCVAVGDNAAGQCNVSGWTNIVAIAARYNTTIGLKADGTCVATGNNAQGQCNVTGWTNIVAIAEGNNHTIGLKSDGTCVAVGWNYYNQCNVTSWTGIYVPTQTINATVNCDSLRQKIVVIGANLDTLRRAATNTFKTADTTRRSALVNSVSADTDRGATVQATAGGDSSRAINLLTVPIFDVARVTCSTTAVNVDTLRNVTFDLVDVTNVDTLRRICMQSELAADSRRSIAVQIAPYYDVRRQTTITSGVLSDTARKTSSSITSAVDTARAVMTGQALVVNMDTLRRVAASASVNADILRKLQGALADITSLSLTISAKSLSDTFAVECFDPAAAVGYRIGGSIKDFVYSFVVDELSITGSHQNITGAYDIDDLLSKDVAYSVTTPVTAQKIIQALAAVLNKTAVVAIDDFRPSDLPFAVVGNQAKAINQGTARDVISKLFGWTDRVPHRLINVYLRGDKLYVLQRGKETSAVAVQRYGVPTITQKRIRTLLSSTDTDGQTAAGTLTGGSDYSTSQTYYTGTKQYGDASVTYVNGLVVSEVQGGRTTTYTYSAGSPPARLVSKQTVSDTEKIITNHFYTGDDLVREEESIYSIKDGQETLETTKVTRYVPLGQGHWGVSVEVDGKIASTNVIRGNPGGLASPFAIETYSADTTVRAPKTRTLRGRYIGDAYIPVTDDATLDAVAAAIEWLDGRIEERVTLDVYDDHIFDLDKRVVFAGAEYYLERNNIMQTPRRFVQRLELVRWY